VQIGSLCAFDVELWAFVRLDYRYRIYIYHARFALRRCWRNEEPWNTLTGSRKNFFSGSHYLQLATNILRTFIGSIFMGVGAVVLGQRLSGYGYGVPKIDIPTTRLAMLTHIKIFSRRNNSACLDRPLSEAII
jgi:hypothetical protein